MADGDDDEFAAFQAEMSKLGAPAASNIGPRAPQVISAAPSGPTTVTTSRAPLPAGHAEHRTTCTSSAARRDQTMIALQTRKLSQPPA